MKPRPRQCGGGVGGGVGGIFTQGKAKGGGENA